MPFGDHPLLCSSCVLERGTACVCACEMCTPCHVPFVNNNDNNNLFPANIIQEWLIRGRLFLLFYLSLVQFFLFPESSLCPSPPVCFFPAIDQHFCQLSLILISQFSFLMTTHLLCFKWHKLSLFIHLCKKGSTRSMVIRLWLRSGYH